MEGSAHSKKGQQRAGGGKGILLRDGKHLPLKHCSLPFLPSPSSLHPPAPPPPHLCEQRGSLIRARPAQSWSGFAPPAHLVSPLTFVDEALRSLQAGAFQRGPWRFHCQGILISWLPSSLFSSSYLMAGVLSLSPSNLLSPPLTPQTHCLWHPS